MGLEMNGGGGITIGDLNLHALIVWGSMLKDEVYQDGGSLNIH